MRDAYDNKPPVRDPGERAGAIWFSFVLVLIPFAGVGAGWASFCCVIGWRLGWTFAG